MVMHPASSQLPLNRRARLTFSMISLEFWAAIGGHGSYDELGNQSRLSKRTASLMGWHVQGPEQAGLSRNQT